MPNISSLTMPDGIVYAIKDSQARKDIEDIKKNGSAGSGGGSGGELLVVGATLDGTTLTFNKTAREILNAMKTTGAVFVYEDSDNQFVANFNMAHIEANGSVSLFAYQFNLTAPTLDDYPTATM